MQAAGTLSNLRAAYNRAAGATERLFEILDTRSEVEEAPDTMELPPVRGWDQF